MELYGSKNLLTRSKYFFFFFNQQTVNRARAKNRRVPTSVTPSFLDLCAALQNEILLLKCCNILFQAADRRTW